MTDLPTTPQVGDHFVLVGTMPSGGVWGYPFGDDTWLVRIGEPLLTREAAANDPEVRRMVAAKSVGTLTVSDDQWRDYWHSNNDLPSGRYAIVPLKVTDDE